jgi:threonine/homoserine/homoserine lactone efflux protein
VFTLTEYLLFCAGAMALIVSPGPDFFYVITRGLAGGRKAGIVSALGIGTGLLCHTILAASGLTLLLLTSNAVFNAMKIAGAIYLIWMGVQVLRAGDTFWKSEKAIEVNIATLYRQGIVTNIFNPKVALTFAAFLTQFVHPERGSESLQIGFLGITLCLLATLWFCIIGTSSGRIGTLLSNKPGIGRTIRLLSGFVLCGLGLKLGFAQRP